MKNQNFSIDANELQINNAISDFCPYGSLDMQAAVNIALRAGKETSFVYDCVSEFVDSCGGKIEDCDPVYCVMDAILQEARNGISELCEFDFMNDLHSGSIDTYGNFMCSEYQADEEAKEELIKVLATNNVSIDDLSEATQYFLYDIEISQDDINAIISELLNAETN